MNRDKRGAYGAELDMHDRSGPCTGRVELDGVGSNCDDRPTECYNKCRPLTVKFTFSDYC